MQAVLAFAIAAASAVAAEQGPNVTSGATGPLMACRGIADNSARLACFDRNAAALQLAIANRQLVVLSPSDVRETRRSLFGFSLPKLPFFGGEGSEEPEVPEIASRVAAASSLGRGRWRIRLEDGAVWETRESAPNYVVPKPGASVRIRRAALGSYILKINTERAVRARRVN